MSVPDRLHLADWQRIRRYAVPARMITECTRARERGDWRAACAAARVDVDIDPALADRAAAPATHLAPDLLRWHLPRALGGFTTLAPDRRYVLIPDEPVGADTVLLTVQAPVSRYGSQRLTLSAVRGADLGGGRGYPVPAYLWDARHAGGLRAALGGSPAPPGGATASTVFAAAGIELGGDPGEHWPRYDDGAVMSIIDPHRLAHDARWLAARLGHRTWTLWID